MCYHDLFIKIVTLLSSNLEGVYETAQRKTGSATAARSRLYLATLLTIALNGRCIIMHILFYRSMLRSLRESRHVIDVRPPDAPVLEQTTYDAPEACNVPTTENVSRDGTLPHLVNEPITATQRPESPASESPDSVRDVLPQSAQLLREHDSPFDERDEDSDSDVREIQETDDPNLYPGGEELDPNSDPLDEPGPLDLHSWEQLARAVKPRLRRTEIPPERQQQKLRAVLDDLERNPGEPSPGLTADLTQKLEQIQEELPDAEEFGPSQAVSPTTERPGKRCCGVITRERPGGSEVD